MNHPPEHPEPPEQPELQLQLPQQFHEHPPPPPPPPFPAIVSAGESDNPMDTESEPENNSHDHPANYNYSDNHHHHVQDNLMDDPLYGENLDDEDEAWVYQHLRSGMAESVTVAVGGTGTATRQKEQQKTQPQPQPQPQPQLQHHHKYLEQAKLLRPRDSDAVLSCPCCFTIVCMDCQQHCTYPNQYRAMFVMNICLKAKLMYDPASKQLIEWTETREMEMQMEMQNHNGADDNDDTLEIYDSVHCIQCQTQVAALDRNEEIYHFFGCLASS